MARSGFWRNAIAAKTPIAVLNSLAETPDRADADDVDIALAGAVAADVVVALPFAPHAEVRHHVPLHAGAVGQPGVVIVGACAAEARDARARLGLRVVAAELAVDRQHRQHGKGADADELERFRLYRPARPACGRLDLAEVVVADLRSEIAIDLVARENAPGGVRVVAGHDP